MIVTFVVKIQSNQNFILVFTVFSITCIIITSGRFGKETNILFMIFLLY